MWDGSFGICGNGEPPRVKSEVVVKTRAGDLRTVKVLKIIGTDCGSYASDFSWQKAPYDWVARIEGQRPTRPIPPICPKCGWRAWPGSSCPAEQHGTHWPKKEDFVIPSDYAELDEALDWSAELKKQ